MTTAWLVLTVTVAGGAGAALRFAVDGAINSLRRRDFPLATSVINISGSLLLGLLSGLALPASGSPTWLTIAGGGLLGGYTTFSTAAVESVQLLAQGKFRGGALNSLGMLVVAVLAAAAGLALGSRL